MSRTSWLELCRAEGMRGAGLREEWRLWRGRAQDFDPNSLEPIAHPLFSRMPEDLGWPPPAQLCLPGLDDGFGDPGALGPFEDRGDRTLIQEALRVEIPSILRTDLRSFWRYWRGR